MLFLSTIILSSSIFSVDVSTTNQTQEIYPTNFQFFYAHYLDSKEILPISNPDTVLLIGSLSSRTIHDDARRDLYFASARAISKIHTTNIDVVANLIWLRLHGSRSIQGAAMNALLRILADDKMFKKLVELVDNSDPLIQELVAKTLVARSERFDESFKTHIDFLSHPNRGTRWAFAKALSSKIKKSPEVQDAVTKFLQNEDSESLREQIQNELLPHYRNASTLPL